MREKKLFIGGLDFQTTEAQVTEALSEFGFVEDIKVPYDSERGRIKGFCFVTMDSAEDADNVLKNLDGSELNGRNIGVKRYVEKRRSMDVRP